jgi:hypothetical protein
LNLLAALNIACFAGSKSATKTFRSSRWLLHIGSPKPSRVAVACVGRKKPRTCSASAQRRHGFTVEALPSSTRTNLDTLYADPHGQQMQSVAQVSIPADHGVAEQRIEVDPDDFDRMATWSGFSSDKGRHPQSELPNRSLNRREGKRSFLRSTKNTMER